MVAEITRRDGEEVTVSVTIRLDGSMLEAEEAIQGALNEAGMLLEQENLVRFDTDGSLIQVGSVRLTSKGQSPQVYETPYGPVQVERHVYQTAQGGKTYCPLENSARLILNATPRWAKIVSYKYASFGADSVVDDLRECNGRTLSNRYCKMLGDAVGTFAMAKEESWNYELPKFDRPVASASVGVDGTCMLLVDDGWRVAMTGTIALYDAQGERLHTIYLGAAPEYGKEEFHARFVRELDRVKSEFPEIAYLGLSDGATDNWSFLSPLTDHQLVDFYHASEYVGKAAMAMFGLKQMKEREAWLADRLHRLKHNQGAATRLWKEMDEYAASHTIRSQSLREGSRIGGHLFPQPEASHELRLPYGSTSTDRKWRNGSRLQGADQAAILPVRFPMERGRCHGSPLHSRPQTNPRSLARLLETYLSIWLHGPTGITSYHTSTRRRPMPVLWPYSWRRRTDGCVQVVFWGGLSATEERHSGVLEPGQSGIWGRCIAERGEGNRQERDACRVLAFVHAFTAVACPRCGHPDHMDRAA